MIEARAQSATPTGRVQAHFDCDGPRTRLKYLRCHAPLKIAKPWADGADLSVMVMDSSPGLLAGDCYDLEWRLGQGARVHLSTQGFTRVHPSTERPCAIRTRIEIAGGARLESFPEPLMLFQDAALRSDCEVEMDGGAALMMGEVWCAGRVGKASPDGGEAFRFHRFSSRLSVRMDGELLFLSRTDLRPDQFDPRSLGAWGDWTHAGTFHVFSRAVDAGWPERLRQRVLGAAGMEGTEGRAENARLDVGASLLHRHGLIVSLLGRRACDLQGVIARLRVATRSLLETR